MMQAASSNKAPDHVLRRTSWEEYWMFILVVAEHRDIIGDM